MSTLQEVQKQWETIRAIRIERLKDWEPQNLTFDFQEMDIMSFQRQVAESMKEALLGDDMFKCDYELVQLVAQLEFEDFKTWHSKSREREMDFVDSTRDITTPKIEAALKDQLTAQLGPDLEF